MRQPVALAERAIEEGLDFINRLALLFDIPDEPAEGLAVYAPHDFRRAQSVATKQVLL